MTRIKYVTCYFRPHQREGVTFLYECVMGVRDGSNVGAVLADSMGLGSVSELQEVPWFSMEYIKSS